MTRIRSLQSWWSRLEGRERLVVGVAVALLALTLLQFAAHAVAAGLAQLRADVDARRASLVLAQELARAAPGGALTGEPLLSVAERVARSVGVSANLRRLEQGEDGRVRARFEGAAFGPLARWLGTVQSDAGAQVEALLIERAATEGFVDASVTLAPGAP